MDSYNVRSLARLCQRIYRQSKPTHIDVLGRIFCRDCKLLLRLTIWRILGPSAELEKSRVSFLQFFKCLRTLYNFFYFLGRFGREKEFTKKGRNEGGKYTVFFVFSSEKGCGPDSPLRNIRKKNRKDQKQILARVLFPENWSELGILQQIGRLTRSPQTLDCLKQKEKEKKWYFWNFQTGLKIIGS